MVDWNLHVAVTYGVELDFLPNISWTLLVKRLQEFNDDSLVARAARVIPQAKRQKLYEGNVPKDIAECAFKHGTIMVNLDHEDFLTEEEEERNPKKTIDKHTNTRV